MTSKHAGYVKVTQALFEQVPRDLTVFELVIHAVRAGRLADVTTWPVEPKATWGSAVFQVYQDGSMRMLSHDFDTSG